MAAPAMAAMPPAARALRQLRELQHIKLDGLRFRLIDAKGEVGDGAGRCGRGPQHAQHAALDAARGARRI